MLKRMCDHKVINQNNKVCECGAVAMEREFELGGVVTLKLDLCEKHSKGFLLTLQSGVMIFKGVPCVGST